MDPVVESLVTSLEGMRDCDEYGEGGIVCKTIKRGANTECSKCIFDIRNAHKRKEVANLIKTWQLVED